MLTVSGAADDAGNVVGREVSHPDAHETWVTVQQLQRGMCGGSRPHFFRGVATVSAAGHSVCTLSTSQQLPDAALDCTQACAAHAQGGWHCHASGGAALQLASDHACVLFVGLQVVTKLFHIVEPDVACFGQKDYQQWRLITRMVGVRLLCAFATLTFDMIHACKQGLQSAWTLQPTLLAA